MSGLSRRHVVAAAWAVPVVAVARPAAAAACSPAEEAYTPNLSVASTTTTSAENGHTVGTFSFVVTNQGRTTIPAGTVYSVRFSTSKAPGNKGKNIDVTMVPGPDFVTTPAGLQSLNPDGPPTGATEFTATLVLASALVPGGTARQVWSIDTATGKGATSLAMTATLTTYSTSCGSTTATGESQIGPVFWGSQAA